MNDPLTLCFAAFVHRIDPIIVSVFGVHLWWYGASYTLGFLNLHLFLRRRRTQLGFSPREAMALTLAVVMGVLLGGRLVEVVFYEAPFYRIHPGLIPALWLGGMATHGLLLGGLGGVAWFCWRTRASVLAVLDALVIPAAFILGMGRIGNFIDGQIVGGLTSLPWGVQFPDAEGVRHPVVLYDGLKNLALIPFLIWLGRRSPRPGVLTATFFILYAGLRVFVDVFREYPTTLLGLATGQSLNLAMTLGGGALLLWARRRRGSGPDANWDVAASRSPGDARPPSLLARWTCGALLVFCLTIPSDWTQDIPRRYGARHPGLEHTWLYPPIEP
jgi:phosphatidylglycerol:prolipoprotein diacylglycerol transferase